MNQPKTKTALSVNSEESRTVIMLPKDGQIWIDYQPMQQGSKLTLEGITIKEGQNTYKVFAGAQLVYSAPSGLHGEVVFKVAWGYINE